MDHEIIARKHNIIKRNDRVPFALNIGIALLKRNVEGELDVVKFSLKVEFISAENCVFFPVNGELGRAVDIVDVPDLGEAIVFDIVDLIPNTIGHLRVG